MSVPGRRHTPPHRAGRPGASSRVEDGILLDVALSQQDLAAMTGTTPESVSRLPRLPGGGLLSGGRSTLRLPDPSRLRDLAAGAG